MALLMPVSKPRSPCFRVENMFVLSSSVESQNNPTYEFFPSRGNSVTLQFLQNTLPANLYPLTWLLPSGKLLMQANWGTMVLDYKNGIEQTLPNVPSYVDPPSPSPDELLC